MFMAVDNFNDLQSFRYFKSIGINILIRRKMKTDAEILSEFNLNEAALDDNSRSLFLRFVRCVNNSGMDWRRKTDDIFHFGRWSALNFRPKLGKISISNPLSFQITNAHKAFTENIPSFGLTFGIGDDYEWNNIDPKNAQKICNYLQKMGGRFEKIKRSPSWPSEANPNQQSVKQILPRGKNDVSLGSPVARSALNVIYYGPPGTGKTYKLTQLIETEYEGRVKFVTFHQSYGYEDFVEGLRPVLVNGGKENSDEVIDNTSKMPRQVGYEIKPGVFKDICKQAREHPGLRYAIFIDEINRGNVSKIFGELITLIEVDKRDFFVEDEKPIIEIVLPYSRDNFSVPCNLDIIGTMNTADRSLAPLDIALRRRFEFVPLIPDTRKKAVDGEPHSAPLADLFVGKIDIRQMLEKINERIEVLSNRDRCIGHAYFIPLKGIEDNEEKLEKLSHVFKDQIIPLLEEYFFDDWKKIGQVLGDHNKSDAEVRFIASEKINRSDLLGEDKNERNEDSSVRYRLNPDVFIKHVANEAVYVGIYKKVPERADPVPPASPSESQ